MKKTRYKIILLFSFLLFLFTFVNCASRGAVQAEEYFSIGMAYYELGKFAEAEKWLNRARSADKTMTASDYNLGRIAFETGRYADAAQHFERILLKDPDNIMALKAAAYSRIKNGETEKAEKLYSRILVLVPESSDDGFNYALVLYAMNNFEKCESVLLKYPLALESNSNSILLLARVQKALGKPEAVDSYAKWLTVHTGSADPQGIYEYAQALEAAGFYARSLEQYADAKKALTGGNIGLKKSTLLFEEARVLLLADPDNKEGITGLNNAVSEGFSDTASIEDLLRDERISQAARDEIRKILNNMLTENVTIEKS